jgi:hypothetical protein
MHKGWNKMISHLKYNYKTSFYDIDNIQKNHDFSRKLSFVYSSEESTRDVVRFFFEDKDDQSKLYVIRCIFRNRTENIRVSSHMIGMSPSNPDGYDVSSNTIKDSVLAKKLESEVLHALVELPEFRLRILLTN